MKSATRLADCLGEQCAYFTLDSPHSGERTMKGAVTARPLLNRREQLLYGRLVRAFPGHVILVNVALVGLVAAFAVCKPDFTPIAVIELDDDRAPVSHRRRRDDILLQSAGIKVIRLLANDIPNEAALRALVAALPLMMRAPVRVSARSPANQLHTT